MKYTYANYSNWTKIGKKISVRYAIRFAEKKSVLRARNVFDSRFIALPIKIAC